MTIREQLGNKPQRVLLTWAWHPKPLPMAVPNSFALAAAQIAQRMKKPSVYTAVRLACRG